MTAEKPFEDAERVGVRPSPSKRRQLPVWQETLLLLGTALLLAIVLKAFFLQAFYIPSQSMEPGLVENDRILVQKVSYWGSAGPERGDVVVFKDPGGWLSAGDITGPQTWPARGLAKVGLYPSGGHLVKRVVGIGGDVVTCCDAEGRLSVNGHTLNEDDYVVPGAECATPGTRPACELSVGPIPDGYLLVMGDNRANSSDSTAHLCGGNQTECSATRGLVAVDDVVGRVFAVAWPRDRLTWVEPSSTFDDVPGAP